MIRFLLFLLFAVNQVGLALDTTHVQPVVSILSPLAYGPACWSSVQLQNLGTAPATVTVEGHKGSGALVALAGSPSISLTLEPGGNLTLRLEVPGEESPEGWVRVRESVADATPDPTVAVSGRTECLNNDRLKTISQTVAFPTRDPWFAAIVDDLPGRSAMILNTSNSAATATVCYSNSISVILPVAKGGIAEPTPVCAEKQFLQIPPFGTAIIPVVRGGNSRFAVSTKGSSLVMRILVPQTETTKTYAVDSTVKFEDSTDPGR